MSGPPPPPPHPTPIQLINFTAFLAQHSNDPQQALVALISRYNSLAHQHALLTVDKEQADKAAERMSVENQALWRSLRNPRPQAAPRQNSHSEAPAGGASSASAASRAGVGAGAAPLRRGLSGDNNNNHNAGRLDLPSGSSSSLTARDDQLSSLVASVSATSVRTKAATPPPISSPRQHSTGLSPGRKASSLDLGHGRLLPTSSSSLHAEHLNLLPGSAAMGPGLDEPYQRSTRTPPPPSRVQMEQRDRSSPRLPSSASMPVISAAGARTPER